MRPRQNQCVEIKKIPALNRHLLICPWVQGMGVVFCKFNLLIYVVPYCSQNSSTLYSIMLYLTILWIMMMYECICANIFILIQYHGNIFPRRVRNQFLPLSPNRARGVLSSPAGRAGVTSHRYRSPGRSSYRISVKLGGDESWGRISDEFVHGRRGSLIKRLTS